MNNCILTDIFVYYKGSDIFNPLLPSVPYMAGSAKTSISTHKGIIKISYEGHDYESVDDKCLS